MCRERVAIPAQRIEGGLTLAADGSDLGETRVNSTRRWTRSWRLPAGCRPSWESLPRRVGWFCRSQAGRRRFSNRRPSRELPRRRLLLGHTTDLIHALARAGSERACDL